MDVKHEDQRKKKKIRRLTRNRGQMQGKRRRHKLMKDNGDTIFADWLFYVLFSFVAAAIEDFTKMELPKSQKNSKKSFMK